MVAALSTSPDLNPLSLYIKEETEERNAAGSVDKDDKKAFLSSSTLDAGDLLPNQNPSIIGESATVRYYQDITQRPIIVSTGLQGVAKTVEEIEEQSKGKYYDVRLSLDVTTGCGGKIWPAAEVLGQYIASTRSNDRWKDKRVVELGAGTGLVGLLAARATQLDKVWITDQIPMMALMQMNLILNEDLSSRCIVAELNWGEAIPEGIPAQPDVLLLADCVYLEVAFQPLVDTMKAMSTRETEILFCYQQRRKADKRFFKMLKKHFTFQDIADDDQIRSKEYNRQGTRLYRVHKIKDQ